MMANDKKENLIYLDHAATTPVDKNVLDVMLPFFNESFGNASSMHAKGREAFFAVYNARKKVAKAIGAKATGDDSKEAVEIYFTSGGTEANNWALRGFAKKGKRIITSAIEHPSIMTTCKLLEQTGVEVVYLPVCDKGLVNPKDLEKELVCNAQNTTLISIMMVNNEIGTIQPIKELAAVARRYKVPFHTDAVQAVGSIPVDVADLGVDMLSLSAHKLYGPKGIGALYIRSGIRPEKLITGGHQERTMRGGTTNVPLIVGFGEAISNAVVDIERNNTHIKKLRDVFVEKVLSEISDCYLNGCMQNRAAGNANFIFEYVEGESILISLDLGGIACSSGSACSSGTLEPSHVLLAMGVKLESAHGSIRFSFGKNNTMDDVYKTVQKLKETIDRLRKLSPLFSQVKGETKRV